MKEKTLRLEPALLQELLPCYELRVRRWGAGDDEMEVWQLPSAATPHLRTAVRVAGLRGWKLELHLHRVLRRLAQDGVRLSTRRGVESERHRITEHRALTLGLLFRALAPMRRRESMARVAEAIDGMEVEEAGYWLGMAMHREHPRRVLSALRMLLTDPAHDARGAR